MKTHKQTHTHTDILTHRHIPSNPQLWAHKHRPTHKQGQSWLKPRCFQEIVLLISYHGWVLLLMKIDGEICEVLCDEHWPYLCVSDMSNSKQKWGMLTIACLKNECQDLGNSARLHSRWTQGQVFSLAATYGNPMSLHTDDWAAVNRAIKTACSQVSIHQYDLLLVHSQL